MKRILLTVFAFTFSLILFTSFASAAEKGSRTNPFSAYDENTITFQPYFWETPKLIKIQLLELSSDNSTNASINNENMFNTKPASDEQWDLFKYKITYISSSKDEALILSDVINYYSDNFYFDSNFKSITPVDIATLGEQYGSLNLSDLEIYQGSSTIAYTAALFKKDNVHPYLRVQKSDSDYYWFSTDPNYKPSNDSGSDGNSNEKTIDFSNTSLSASVSGNSPIYTGSALKPSVLVKANGKKLTKNRDYTITYSKNVNVGYGYFSIKGIGAYTGTKTFKFYIKPQKTNLYSAKNSKSKTVYLKWKKSTGAKYYKVYYKTGSKTKSVKTTSTSATIKKLSKNKTYKFYVISYFDSKIYSSNSNTKNIKIKK